MTIKVTPLAAALGAEVELPDGPLDADTRAALLAAWRRHLVLRVRGLSLDAQGFLAFSRMFGDLESHDNYQGELRHPDHPELLMIRSTTVRGERIVFGQQWHADLTYTLRPAKGACLQCLVLPPVGGDTLFTNMQLAYERLSPAMRRIVDRLEAVHDLGNGRSHRDKTPEQKAAVRLRNPPVVQPVVRRHPETGRKSLYISEWMCRRFVGMSEEESRGLLEFLFRHSTQEAFTFRQTWQVGDIVVWDNDATLHLALADYPAGARRELMRTSLVGVPSGRPWVDAAPQAASTGAPSSSSSSRAP